LSQYFPNTPNDWTWSSSQQYGVAGSAWSVNFYLGNVNSNYTNSAFTVRLVRNDLCISNCSGTTSVDGPQALSFLDQDGVLPAQLVKSNAIIVTGFGGSARISVTGGSYSLNGGAYTSVPGVVIDGDMVRVVVTSSSQYNTPVNATLFIGDTHNTFTVTTMSAPTQDSVPDTFSFNDRLSVVPGQIVISNNIKVAGIDSTTAISISGGSYSINSRSFTDAAGVVTNGDQVQVMLNASRQYGTSLDAVLTIGGVRDTFTVTTLEAPVDTTPDVFMFKDQLGVSPGQVVLSDAIDILGIDAPAAISISGGSYAVNGGAFTRSAGYVYRGDRVQIMVNASSRYNTALDAILVVGSISDIFTVTTQGPPLDTVPDPFSFAEQTGLAPGQSVASSSINVRGIDAPSAISITGGSYSVNGGLFTTASGMVSQGDWVQVMLTAPGLYSRSSAATLTIGGISNTFTVTTQAVPLDTTPDSFVFIDQTELAFGREVVSSPVNVSGLSAPVSISVLGGQYSLNGGEFTTQVGAVNTGDRVVLRVLSANDYNQTVTATLTISTVSGTFMVKTLITPPWDKALISRPVNLLPKIGGGDSYGSTMDGFNDVLWIAAPQATSQGFKRGVIYPWQRGSDGRFVEGNALSQGVAGDQFGRRMVFDQAFAFVAAPYVDRDALKDIGRVYVYQRQGDRYVPGKTLEAPESYGNAQFGQAIGVSANWLAVGAPGVGKDDGRVYLYAYERGQWVRRQTLSAPKGQEGSRFGTGLALADDWLVVGAPQGKRDTHLGLRSGMVFAYQLKGDQWQATDRLPLPDANKHRAGELGTVIKLVGDRLAVAAPKTSISNADTTHSQAGRIFLYSLNGATQTWHLDDGLQMPEKYLFK
ncbi:MAG: hypothetical protein ACR2HF_05560, partial [Methylococcaceae bacterium]